MDTLTKNFRRSEFECRCGCGLDTISYELVEALQILREQLGCAIHVTSGCRCEAHNQAVGGEENSQHLLKNGCRAADIVVRNMTPRQVAREAERIEVFRNSGIGNYRGFTHLDVRRWKARW
ncbi:D-Ala-D-Ala carboxypeptidase family metallohydrolase [Candidatus Magnetobacterium casense]|uniref:Peptidase M15A C-terminal domain-containing protein n=1 Tax=Candidatus Magnetobacterium casense TaxID=1455061 RepID=A0ABS6S499_9BACT|nr:D-Ala-D-Ala carboxypeptidase family metallohydrolase [Candidatus Magnetobacterium casensis]MBV6343666.1 hypothetical protein [Candidatus Magnetobacterium casensis]